MIKIGIDNSCIQIKFLPLLKKLKGFSNQKLIRVDTVSKTRRELRNWGKSHDDEIIQLIHSFVNDVIWGGFIHDGLTQEEEIAVLDNYRGFTSKQRDAIQEELKKILLPYGFITKKPMNEAIDTIILAEHIARSADFFISNDNVYFVNNNVSKIEEKFPNIKIRRFDEDFISELTTVLSN